MEKGKLWGFFKRCASCGSKVPQSDGHDRCLFCLGEAHRADACQHCKNFSRQARKNRELRLEVHLLKSSLRPPPMSEASVPTQDPMAQQTRPVVAASSVAGPSVATSSGVAIATTPLPSSGPSPHKRPPLAASMEGTSSAAPPAKKIKMSHKSKGDKNGSKLKEGKKLKPKKLKTSTLPSKESATPLVREEEVVKPSTSPPKKLLSSPHRRTPLTYQQPEVTPVLISSGSDHEHRTTIPLDKRLEKRSVSRSPSVDSRLSTAHCQGLERDTERGHSAPSKPCTDSNLPATVCYWDSKRCEYVYEEPSPESRHVSPSHQYRGHIYHRSPRDYYDKDYGDSRYRRSPSWARHESRSSPRMRSPSRYRRGGDYQYVRVSPPPPPHYQRRSPPMLHREDSLHFRGRDSTPRGYEDFARSRHGQPIPHAPRPAPSATYVPRRDGHDRVEEYPPSPPPITVPRPVPDKDSVRPAPLPSPVKDLPSIPPHSDSGSDADSDAEDVSSDLPDEAHPDDTSLDQKVTDDLPISPSEDVKSYGDLIKKVAARLGLPTSQPQPAVEDDVVLDVLDRNLSTTIAIPLSKGLLRSVQSAWENPASAPVSSRRLDHMYRVQEKSAEFLFSHPKPNSVVVSSSARGRKHQSTPPDREGKKMDSFGRRFYSAGALGIKTGNYMACIARFMHALFEDMSDLIPHLPDDKRVKALQLQSDGLAAAKQEIASAKHSLETASKTLATAVALRRHSWLRSTNLQYDTRTVVEDLAFDGLGLFNAATDTTLQDREKSIKASRSLGITGPQKGQRSRSSSGRSWYQKQFPARSPDRVWRPRSQQQQRPYYSKQKPSHQNQGRSKPNRSAKQGV